MANVRRLIIITYLALVIPILARAPASYFPKGAFADETRLNDFLTNWFSNELRSLKEPSLYQQRNAASVESYRFLWLRSFQHPLCVSLSIGGDGAGILTLKIANGSGKKPGRIIESHKLTVSKEKTTHFRDSISALGFWTLRGDISQARGPDGSEWILEGTKDARYHMIEEWSPKSGAVRSLGLALALDLGHAKIPPEQTY
jgi:hypothetical protein